MQAEAPTRRQSREPAQSVHALQIPEALLKIQTVVTVTGLSESSIRRRVKDGKFPRPVKDEVCARFTRWVAADVSNWLRAKGAR